MNGYCPCGCGAWTHGVMCDDNAIDLGPVAADDYACLIASSLADDCECSECGSLEPVNEYGLCDTCAG